MKKRISLFLLFVMSCVVSLYAQQIPIIHSGNETYSHQDIESSFTGFTMDFTTTYAPPASITDLNHSYDNGKLYVKLDLGEDYISNSNSQFEYEIEFDLEITDNGSQVYLKEGIKLLLNSITPERWYYVDISKFDRIEDVTISNFSFSKIPPTDAQILDRIRFSAEFEIEYLVDVKKSANNAYSQLSPIRVSHYTTSDYIDFAWNPNGHTFPSYQLQVLKLKNINPSIVAVGIINANIDWSKALSVEVNGSRESVKLTIGEGSGFYVWRVRPIGNLNQGGIANSDNYGAWTGHPAQNSMVTVSYSNTQGGPYQYFFYSDPNEDLNWIYSRIFTENNKVQETRSYGGYLGHTKQVQVKRDADENVMISQQFQDYSGRDALSTMPVPVEASNGLPGYKENLAKNSLNNDYTVSDFDDDSKIFDPGEFGPTGPYKYYSNNNTTTGEENIANAEGFPYTRTIYFNDGTGRVMEMSGAGKKNSIGSQSSGQGHTTRYMYSTPSEDELIRVFGNEAPDPSSIQKKITIDPNNTKSVSYMNMEGKVLATSLSYNPNDPLEPVGSTGSSLNVNSLYKSVESDRGLISTKKIALTENTALQLDYHYPCDPIDLGCSGSLECSYNVEFYVYDLLSETYYKSEIYSVSTGFSCAGSIDDIESGAWYRHVLGSGTPTTLPNLPNLDPGTYIVVKRLLNSIDIQATLNQFQDDLESGFEPIVKMLQDKLKGVDDDNELALAFTYLGNFEDDLNDAQNIAITTYTYTNLQADYSDYFDLTNWDPIADQDKYDNLTFSLSSTSTFDTPDDMSFGSGGGCCEVNVPTSYEFQYKCPDPAAIDPLTYSHPYIDFEKFLELRTAAYRAQTGVQMYSNPTDPSVPALLTGYRPGQFNRMIGHMIKDQYDPDVPGYSGNNNPTYQYECEDLWECWISVVGGYEDIIASMLGGTANPSEAADDDNNDSSGDDTDKPVDDEGDKNAGGFLLKWIVKRALSDRIRQDVGTPAFTMNLAEQFLQCTGFKFEEILHANSPSPADPQNADYQDKSSSYALDNSGDLIYPYIKDPVYAFKYYFYDHIISSSLTPRWPVPEVEMCYIQWPCSNMCSTKGLCASNHDTWSMGERNTYYNVIKSMEVPPSTWTQTASGGCPSYNDMVADLTVMKTNALTACAGKESQIRQEITSVFLDNCYELGGCPGPGIITEEEIDIMVEDVITECVSSVNSICDPHITNSQSGYPMCTTSVCSVLVSPNCMPFTYYETHYLPPCDMTRLNALQFFQFEMSRDFTNDVEMIDGLNVATPAFISNCSPPAIGHPTNAWNATPDECDKENKQLTPRTITSQVN